MSLLIVTSRYLKSGGKKAESKRRNYTKYIASREGAEIRDQTKNDLGATPTEKQNQLLKELLNDFPEAKHYLEYEDFTTHPTAENASELISTIIERNADVIGNRQNFVGYMAMRPGAEIRGQHGLFNGSDEPIVLNRVAEEVAHHPGNVWSHVISLRREDAVRLGYDNSDMWRELVKRHITDIAAAQKISLVNMKWYAAFHNTTHHPHIHLIVYSANPKEGYLTKEGINKIRSVFANDIFHDDLQSIYQEQTFNRDELKRISQNQISELVQQIQRNDFRDSQLEKLVQQLYSQLQNVSGKKVYKYLPQEVKQTVNEIFSELAKNEQITKLYEEWCDLERLKYKTYTQHEQEIPPINENKVFTPVRNIIIKAVANMMWDSYISEPEIIPDDNDDGTDNNIEIIVDETSDYREKEAASEFYIEWSDDYKNACKLFNKKDSSENENHKTLQLLKSEAGKGNVVAMHDLGKLYSSENFGMFDSEESQKYYEKALEGFIRIEATATKLRPYIQYRIGKMYRYGLGTEKNHDKAFQWFEKSAQAGNKYAQYSLANQYYYGNGTEKNLSFAHMWYAKSAEQGMPYAGYALAQMYAKGEEVVKNDKTAQRYYNRALNGFLSIGESGQADENLLYKIGRMYMRGLGTDTDMPKAIEYFQQSARLGNIGAKRYLALEYISGEYLEQDIDKGISALTECANIGDIIAAYKLGKIYFSGEFVYSDYNNAEKYLKIAADAGNEYAMFTLAKLYLKEEKYNLEKAVSMLEASCTNSDIQPYAAYSLAKILFEDNEYHNQERAIRLLESAADKNRWASYLLGKIYLYGTDEIERDKDLAVLWLTKSAQNGNEFAQLLLEKCEKYENEMFATTVLGLLVNLSRIIEDDYTKEQRKLQSRIDSKLLRMIHRKNIELGIKSECDQLY